MGLAQAPLFCSNVCTPRGSNMKFRACLSSDTALLAVLIGAAIAAAPASALEILSALMSVNPNGLDPANIGETNVPKTG